MGVGYVILKARASAGLTQDELARKIGSSQAAIARWEGGSQMPSVRSLLKIADATGFELAIGLHQPGESHSKFAVLETVSALTR
ncbi:MAG: hypothetical protein DCC49_02075 [Acidobacteria bacterium]|nr:MAG: hypothetical protein DCC49_02075 [Acidobacteriota bacterium]